PDALTQRVDAAGRALGGIEQVYRVTQPRVRGQQRVEGPLVGEVVDRHQAAGVGKKTVPGIYRLHQQWPEARVPVIAMQDLRRKAHVLAAQQRRVCQQQEAQVLIGVGGIQARASIQRGDRKSTRLNSSHVKISYAVFCLKKKIHKQIVLRRIK